MGQHCHVKICINYRLDHRVGGLEVYNSLKDQLLHAQFDPFRYWYLHKCISHTWDMKKEKIHNITFIFVRKSTSHTYSRIEYIISLKIKNCKVINKHILYPNLVFYKNDPQYQNLIHIKLF